MLSTQLTSSATCECSRRLTDVQRLLNSCTISSYNAPPVARPQQARQLRGLRTRATHSVCSSAATLPEEQVESVTGAPLVESSSVRTKRANRVPSFPFVRIAGQDEMKLALMLNVIDSKIGGVLVMGDRGTGKSVAVRAMVEMLPRIEVVPDDGFNSHPSDPKLMSQDTLEQFQRGETLPSTTMPTPLVELPLGATEDRICGTIDIEKALSEGIKAYEPGLLAKANRGILYVDEVNLLDDGLVDVVLDSAASGVNTVEREGVSIVHPAKFVMIGSGNPSEGELRPQLLDRFGLSVDVSTLQNMEQRVGLVMDRMSYEADPDKFCASVEEEQQRLRDKLTSATERLSDVEVSRAVRLQISEICSLLNVDGIRGDMVVNRAARALVAYEGRREVNIEDVARVIGLCLNHRMRKDPLDPIDNGTKVALAFRRVTNPKAAKEEEDASKESGNTKEEKSAAKAGAWGGLPGR